MARDQVAISGVSSFTGMWIAIEFKRAGFQVVGLCSQRDLQAYGESMASLRLRRLVREGIILQFGMEATDHKMSAWIAAQKLNYFILHHHFVFNYRDKSYDLDRARKVSVDPLPSLTKALETSGVKRVIYSSSYFENLPVDVSPYGFSKGEVWRHLYSLSSGKKYSLAKMIIANPIGPMENSDRLIPQLIKASRDGKSFTMNNPAGITYPVPITVLSRAYVELMLNTTAAENSPSLDAWTNKRLADETLAELVDSRMHHKPCALILKPSPPQAPIPFYEANTTCDWASFWDFYAQNEANPA